MFRQKRQTVWKSFSIPYYLSIVVLLPEEHIVEKIKKTVLNPDINLWIKMKMFWSCFHF